MCVTDDSVTPTSNGCSQNFYLSALTVQQVKGQIPGVANTAGMMK